MCVCVYVCMDVFMVRYVEIIEFMDTIDIIENKQYIYMLAITELTAIIAI